MNEPNTTQTDRRSDASTHDMSNSGYSPSSQLFGTRSRIVASSNAGITIGVIGIAVFVLLMLFTNPEREVVGLYVMGLIFCLLVVGIPIGIALTGAGALGVWVLSGMGGLELLFRGSVYTATSSWSLSVIPMFVLMGVVLWKTGLTEKAFVAANNWLGRLPGGIALGTNFAGAALAAASGSSIANVYAMGRVAIPEMIRNGYKTSLATATVAAAGMLGQIIPPSVLLVIYAGVAQTSVGPQLLAGIVPGVLLAVAFGVMIVIRVSLKPELAGNSARANPVSWSEKFRSARGIIPVAIVGLVIIGGLTTGWFTPTEAGAVGAIAAVTLGWISRSKAAGRSSYLRTLKEPLAETAMSVAAIFLLIIGVAFLNRALALSRIPSNLADWVAELGLSSFAFLLLLTCAFLIMGMFLEPMAIILLTVPVLAEPVSALGIDLIWFGVFIVLVGEIGYVSPPIGLLSFVVHKMSQDPAVNHGRKVGLQEVWIGVLPFVATSILVAILMIIWPEIALWLPSVSGSG